MAVPDTPAMHISGSEHMEMDTYVLAKTYNCYIGTIFSGYQIESAYVCTYIRRTVAVVEIALQ